MIFLMVTAIIMGVVGAQTGIISDALCSNSNKITEYALLILLFMVGFDIGRDKTAFFELLKRDKFAFLVPVGTIIGTFTGGVVASSFIKLPLTDTLAVSAGFGWYSLSAVIIADVKGSDLGSIAFLANVFRELISILSIAFTNGFILSSLVPVLVPIFL